MKQRQTSYAFLMEMLWVSGFFILSACIFIMVFVKADRVSRGADDLNQAVLAAQNAMEDTFAAYPEQTGRSLTAPKGQETSYFTVDVTSSEKDHLLDVTVKVSDKNGSLIYTLNGSHYIPGKDVSDEK